MDSLEMPNKVIEKDGYYISYNDFNNISKEETALVVETVLDDISSRTYFILYGDYREEYSDLKNLAECLEFFIEQANGNLTFWSDSDDTAKKMLKEIKGE